MNKTYLELVEEARKKKLKETIKCKKELAKLYTEAYKDIAGKINATNPNIWAAQYQEELRKRIEKLNPALLKSIQGYIQNAASYGVAPEQGLFMNIQGAKAHEIMANLAKIPQKVAHELMAGKFYQDGAGLSARIWNYSKQDQKGVDYIIQQGLLQKKSTLELAKDLEKYLNPLAMKDFEWRKVYPNAGSKTIDFNAFRLASTSITHAYQLATIRAAKENPFAEGLKWHSALSTRTCELCRSRHGQVFKIDEVPLDHPLGLCTTYSVITKSMEEIGEELRKEAHKQPKEYFTVKKLQQKIADIDAKQAAMNASGKMNPADAAKYAQLTDEKNKLQEMLNKKLTAQEIKKLKKEEAALQDSLKQMPVKTYSGIWKDDVTTKDWAAKQHSIPAKKKYLQDKYLYSIDLAEEQKWEKLLKELSRFEYEAKKYHDIEEKLNKVRNDLKKLQKNGIISQDDRFSDARKNKAFWFKKKPDADKHLRPTSGDVWKNSSTAERRAAYDYTAGSGGFNRPLRGYDTTWYNFKGVGKVSLNNEGREKAIQHLTDMIDRSTYPFDIWLQRGVNIEGTAGFLGIDEKKLINLSQADLEILLIDKKVKDTAFFSCGSAKGQGFSNDCIFNVYCPEGTKMLYAEPFSHYGDGNKMNWDGNSKQYSFGSEFETIIQRGTEFRIKKVEKSGGKIFFDIEVTDQR